ncbi:hypothetical protein WJX72_006095 [[Myrmecia] bisecta]|uniref:Major facilitator superfamily (MFS) profile domain-containing protein n=1 Tax=[Myrmecia] bisecta TaxID=41462 RepID=A0AAW1PD72_9CHLO
MFCEAYYIFSVGNVKPVWAEAYPECFKGNKGCSQTFLNALNYSQVSGLILGMVALGFTVDRIGRRWGSICTASVMFVGGILLTVAQGPSQHAVFLFLIVAQTVFGFGVGGEFPVAASSASERAEGSEKLKSRRGQTVVLVFAMQAWGNLLNVAVLLIFLAALGQSHPPYDNTALEITWRMSYGLGLIPISYMLYHRIFVLKESAVWQAERKAKAAQHGTNSKRDWRAMRYLVTHYWHRLLGTALGWFAWDFYYYGNKLFQSEFIGIIHPGTSLTGVLEYNFLNSSVALFGYYFAAFTIDKAWMGRRRMQVVGFGWLFALFLICGLAFNQLTASANNLKWFQALYYISSFWAQFGPNATTFLLAGELFPTETRGMAHGISAAVGKLGALSADIIMGKASDRSKFYLSAGAGALGVVVTLLFIPEIFSLDLQEGDRRWERINAGKSREYTGEAVNPKNLSWLGAVGL